MTGIEDFPIVLDRVRNELQPQYMVCRADQHPLNILSRKLSARSFPPHYSVDIVGFFCVADLELKSAGSHHQIYRATFPALSNRMPGQREPLDAKVNYWRELDPLG
jgi:hypothetical protein